MKLLRALKRRVVSDHAAPRMVLTGAFRGLRLYINMNSGTQVWLGLFEREVYPSLVRQTRDIRSAVDIGAAAGEYTLFLLARTGAEVVVAVEPIEAERDLLRRNLALNQLDVSDPRLRLVVDTIGTTAWGRQHTLDELLRELPRPVFVKLDADGSEVDILESAPQAVADPRICWLIETHRPDLEAGVLEIFGRHGRRTRILYNAWWRRFIPEQRTAHNRWLTVD